MEMRLEFVSGCDPVHDVFRYEVRLDRRDPVTFYAFHVVQPFQKLEETLSRRTSEVACIHSSDDYFLDSRRGDLPCLGDDVIDRDIPGKPPRERHCAVCAEVVASILDFEERTGPLFGRICLKDILPDACFLNGSDPKHLQGPCHHQAFLLRSEYQADPFYVKQFLPP